MIIKIKKKKSALSFCNVKTPDLNHLYLLTFWPQAHRNISISTSSIE